MPKITAATNAQQRKQTRQAIFQAFGKLLFERGLPSLTITDVAEQAGIGRSAVYNYFSDIEELLVYYALDETERFLANLRHKIQHINNPVERLGVYITAQIEDLGSRHLPPGPAMRSVLSQESYNRLADHVEELMTLLETILDEAITQGYLLPTDLREAAALVHGSLTASADRSVEEESPEAYKQHVERTVRFIQRGLGARFQAIDGKEIPVRIKKPLKKLQAEKQHAHQSKLNTRA